jgi:hypothetical protein
MISNQLDIKSLRNYGIHGAPGLLMGIGAGFILGFILFIILSSLTVIYPGINSYNATNYGKGGGLVDVKKIQFNALRF